MYLSQPQTSALSFRRPQQHETREHPSPEVPYGKHKHLGEEHGPAKPSGKPGAAQRLRTKPVVPAPLFISDKQQRHKARGGLACSSSGVGGRKADGPVDTQVSGSVLTASRSEASPKLRLHCSFFFLLFLPLQPSHPPPPLCPLSHRAGFARTGV